MNERAIVTKFIKKLKAEYPDAVIYKINDRFTKYIPDVYVQVEGITFWFEFKKDKASMKTKHAQRQDIELRRLATQGANTYMIFDADVAIHYINQEVKLSWA